MTAVIDRPLSVHICTRDRPRSLSRLVGGLRAVVDGLDATVTVYDDSTTDSSRRGCQEVCATAPLDVRYFDEPDRQKLLAEARAAIPSAEACLDVSRPLGAPGWDLAGVRFTAMLQGALPDRPPVHLFLDDDIRVADCSYAGRSFSVDASAVNKVVRAEAEEDGVFAAGASFVGRPDLSALEHFEAFLDRVAAGDVADGSAWFPVAVTHVPHVHPDGPGISGGFMLTTRPALRTAPLARSYNEDWLWLRQLPLAGGTIREMDIAVVHAGPLRARLSARSLVLQFEGEVLDLAFALGGASADGLVGEAFATCASRLDAVLHRARGLSAMSPAVAAGVRALEGARVQVRRVPSATYAERLAEHLRRTLRWRDAFAVLD